MSSFKMEDVRDLLRKTVRENKLCCCAGEFVYANCRKLEALQEPREYNCPVCQVIACISQSPEPIIYTSSVKISQTAKGAATVDIHIYGIEDADTCKRAVQLYIDTLVLKAKDMVFASEVKA
jgi:hypothetical protein